MINYNDNPIMLYWSYFQIVNTIEDFLECLQKLSKVMIINTASYIKQILLISDLNEINNKNIINDFIIKDKD